MATIILTRDVAMNMLAEDEVDRLDRGELVQAFIDGIAGWYSKSSAELVEAAAEFMDMDIVIVEGDEQ
jgi:hypothetical protein